MEKISNMLKKIINYILNNNLNIDKATFFTVVIGQITIYGILLTFYQFVAGYRGSEKSVTKYLGKDIAEFFVYKNLTIFKKIISKKIFGILLILEILYKPFMTIYGDLIGKKVINIITFMWFLFAIGYFILFVILFIQCTKSVLMIKMYSDIKIDNYIFEEIDKYFLKNMDKKRINNMDMLKRNLTNLYSAIQVDDNVELQSRYNHLIDLFFIQYIKWKQYEINDSTKDKKLKNQIPWIESLNSEVHLLREIINEKYFQLDEQNIRLLIKFYIDLIRLNLTSAKLAGYSKIKYNSHDNSAMEIREEIIDVSEWQELTLNIYQKLSDEMKQELIRLLQKDVNQQVNLYEYYYKECINDLIRVEIDCIFSEKREQRDFIKIFGQVIKNKYFNDFCTQIIRDKVIYHSRFNAVEIIGQLNGKNCMYLFIYLILYYSIYRFRFDWKYININVLRILWNQHSCAQEYVKEVIEEVRNSNIGHRFKTEMYFKLMEYINASCDSELFNTVYKDKILDVFYIWTIKISVINQYNLVYWTCEDTLDIDVQIKIINGLAKHDELMSYESIYNWVQYVRYNIFAGLNSFPEKLNISLRSLILTNMNAVIVSNYMRVNRYYLGNEMGAYLLLKIHELPDKIQKKKQIKEVVKRTFISSNMDIDEYINMIEEECYTYRCEINYVQREKMKAYLIKTF